MVFNYLTDNKDDHCKNFSFYVSERSTSGRLLPQGRKNRTGGYSWHLAPAYDLTLCTEGYNGEHATSVNGTGNPTLEDMIAIGTKEMDFMEGDFDGAFRFWNISDSKMKKDVVLPDDWKNVQYAKDETLPVARISGMCH